MSSGDMKEKELIALLGDDKLKNIGEQLAEIVWQHNLQKSPGVCRKLFDYFSDVITGWNCATDAIEIDVEEHSKIVLFRDESIFSAFLEGNAHLAPIYGSQDCEKRLFPNMFVAAISEEKPIRKTIGFCGAAYSQVIVFQKESDFRIALSANPHMEAIIGESEEEKRDFPGVYIAGIMSSLHRGRSADGHTAIQK